MKEERKDGRNERRKVGTIGGMQGRMKGGKKEGKEKYIILEFYKFRASKHTHVQLYTVHRNTRHACTPKHTCLSKDS